MDKFGIRMNPSTTFSDTIKVLALSGYLSHVFRFRHLDGPAS